MNEWAEQLAYESLNPDSPRDRAEQQADLVWCVARLAGIDWSREAILQSWGFAPLQTHASAAACSHELTTDDTAAALRLALGG